MTKYAVELTDPKDTHRILQECYENLTTGRLGPVWLSIPVDVQSTQVPDMISTRLDLKTDTIRVLPDEFTQLWLKSKRPIVLAGNGIHMSKTKEKFREFIKNHDIPYVVTFFGSDLGDDYVGKTGLIGNRSGNSAIQNADLILCLGSRLSKNITGYNRDLFAREAKVVYLDIDKSEFMEKKQLDMKLHMDLKTFFDIELPKVNWDKK